MLFGHQNDAHQPQPQAAEQPGQVEPGFLGPQDQVAQTVAPQAPAAQNVPAPQAPAASVNPLAVDSATGVSLPAVPQSPSGPVDAVADAAAPVDEGQPSVLNQPSDPSASAPEVPEAAPEPVAAPNAASAPEPQMESTPPDSGSPFSASTTADPAPAPVLDQAEEDHEAAAIAQELDTPGETNSTVLGQEPAAAEAPAAPDVPSDLQPAPSFDAPAVESASQTPAAPQTHDNNPLLDLKQQAIAQLSPLISHLDQGPEEKFRTTMMLLQSTDNPALLHEAYTSAQAITDETVRAQALLDVVNEINYFTQQQDAQAA